MSLICVLDISCRSTYSSTFFGTKYFEPFSPLNDKRGPPPSPEHASFHEIIWNVQFANFSILKFLPYLIPLHHRYVYLEKCVRKLESLVCIVFHLELVHLPSAIWVYTLHCWQNLLLQSYVLQNFYPIQQPLTFQLVIYAKI